MIPVSGKLKDNLRKKYGITQNLPKNVTKKPVLSDCYSCEHYEREPEIGHLATIAGSAHGFCVLDAREE